MIRTDTHCPSQINPSEYEYVAQEHMKIEGIGDCSFILEMRRRIQEHMAKTGGTYSKHVHGGNCHICGSVNAIYAVLFYHQPTNSYIRTGQDCANKLDSSCDGESNTFRKNVQNALEHQAGKQKAKAILDEAGLSTCWDITQKIETDYYAAKEAYDAEVTAAYAANAMSSSLLNKNWLPRVGHQEQIISDIVAKLVQYGSLSPKQLEFLGKLLDQIKNRAGIEAQRKLDNDAAAPCPTGRVEISGVILSTRDENTDFGLITKMLVRADSGFKVWSTLPRSAGAAKGDRIVFKATVTPSEKDNKFGFGRRPTLVRVEQKQEQVAEAVTV